MKPPDFGFSSAGVVAGVVVALAVGVVATEVVGTGFASTGERFKPGIGRAGGAARDSFLLDSLKQWPGM